MRRRRRQQQTRQHTATLLQIRKLVSCFPSQPRRRRFPSLSRCCCACGLRQPQRQFLLALLGASAFCASVAAASLHWAPRARGMSSRRVGRGGAATKRSGPPPEHRDSTRGAHGKLAATTPIFGRCRCRPYSLLPSEFATGKAPVDSPFPFPSISKSTTMKLARLNQNATTSKTRSRHLVMAIAQLDLHLNDFAFQPNRSRLPSRH